MARSQLRRSRAPRSKGPARRAANRRRRAARKQKGRTLQELRASGFQLLRRSLPGLLIAGAVSLALGGSYAGYRWLTGSPRFAIQELTIAGAERLGPEQVSHLLALPEKAANIFITDMDTLEARLVASPWIASAEVSRALPDTLEIEIREQRAVAAIELGGLYLLNEAGEPFKRASLSSEDLEGLCIITGVDRSEFLRAPTESRARISHALEALRLYEVNHARPRLGELHLDAQHGIRLITYEHAIAIHLGEPRGAELEGRFRAFDSAWQALDAEEHAAARAFRIANRTPSDRVTVAFAGN